MRFVAKQRIAFDGKSWWCVYDKQRKGWSTYLCHGKFKTKREAEWCIAYNAKFVA